MLIQKGPIVVDDLDNRFASFVSAGVKDGVPANGSGWNCRFSCLLDRQSWLEELNAAGRNEKATGLIHCFPEGLLGLFNSSCFACISKLFVAGISITFPVRFLEVNVGSPRPINRGQF